MRPRCTDAEHDRAIDTDAIWSTWIPLAPQEWPWGDVYEQANCPKCGSTRARLIACGMEREEVDDAAA